MKHAGTTALMVVHAQTGQPAGIITQADIARAIADGKDLNDVRVHAVMTTRPALTCACRKPVPPGQMRRSTPSAWSRVWRRAAGVGRAGGAMIFGLWA
jgi:CBS domain-containing protein